MTSSTPLRWRRPEQRHPAHETARRIVARGLHGASVALARLALSLAAPAAQPKLSEAHLEFHAEAGAPEGALYLDGRLVGWVQGVTRL